MHHIIAGSALLIKWKLRFRLFSWSIIKKSFEKLFIALGWEHNEGKQCHVCLWSVAHIGLLSWLIKITMCVFNEWLYAGLFWFWLHTTILSFSRSEYHRCCFCKVSLFTVFCSFCSLNIRCATVNLCCALIKYSYWLKLTSEAMFECLVDKSQASVCNSSVTHSMLWRERTTGFY